MKMSRREMRVNAIISLYQISLYEKNNIEYDKQEVILENCLEKNDFIEQLVYGVLENNEEFENLINSHLKNWTLSRLGLLDASILKVATFEILKTDTPPKICINEAIEISKKYCDESVVGIVNSVLDKINTENVNGQ